jgi:FG-GAP repeat
MTGIALSTVTLPDTGSATYRTAKVTLGWTAPTERFTDQYSSYQLRCDVKPLDLASTDVNAQTQWWNGARSITLPTGFKPPSNSLDVDFRAGESNFCILRATDALNQATPLVNTTEVTVPFRTQKFTPTLTGRLAGYDVTGVGDIDGDGTDDLLVGGLGGAYLVYGSTTGWASGTPSVTFSAEIASDSAASWTGWQVAGLGDFDGDGHSDFAIAAPFWNGTNPTSGRVFVFYGRTARDWPTTVDLTGACAADLCFENTNSDLFGLSIESAGDFNGDNVADLAVGAPSAASGGRLYILLGKSYEAGLTKSGTFWQQAVPVDTSPLLQGFVITGSTTVTQMGSSVVGIGNFDATAGDDLIVSALGDGSNTGKVYFLSGHAYAIGSQTGLLPLALGELGLRPSVNGTPSGAFIAEGPTGSFGSAVYALGNVYNVPGANKPGVLDIAIQQAQAGGFFVYPGDNNFAVVDQIQVNPVIANTHIGVSVGQGRVRGDLDGDGLTELLASDEPSSGTVPGVGHLWYGDTLTTKIGGGHLLSAGDSSTLAPAASAFVRTRVAEFVGDLNGDGKLDLVIGGPGDTSAFTDDGEFTILY